MLRSIQALVLNRAQVFASTRRPVRLSWKARLLVRSIPVALLLQEIVVVLQALRCQTGFQLPEIRFRDSNNVINKSWSETPGLAYNIASHLLFWQTTQDSCRTVEMIPATGDSLSWHGSARLLWPVFLVLGASQLAEVVASAVQGRQPRSETGISVFEHSLAFAEAETVSRAAVGIGLFGLPKSSGQGANATESDSPSQGKVHSFTRLMLLQKLNVPPEVLLICLISLCSHLSSQLLAISGRQHKYRLINTTVWGMSFLALFCYSFIAYASPAAPEEMHIIRYPTVCIVGFLPHLVTVLGATICFQVYVFAIGSVLLSPSSQWQGLSLRQKLQTAHTNMSANSSMNSIPISMSDDFYQVVLRIGYQMLMAAAAAVYFNEGLQVTLSPQTWLEKVRFDEATKQGVQHPTLVPLELQRDFAGGDGFGLVDESPQVGSNGMSLPSGYAKERKTVANLGKASAAAMTEEGVGVSQRSGRWAMSWKLVEQSSELGAYCVARLALSVLGRTFGDKISAPAWLVQAARIHQLPQDEQEKTKSENNQQPVIEFWRLTDRGELQAAKEGSNIDVEYETRRRFAIESGDFEPVPERRLDSHLYGWFVSNGWWGESDSSGEYRPPRQDAGADFDATSQITSASSEWEGSSTASAGSDMTVTPARARQRPTWSPSILEDVDEEPDPLYSEFTNMIDPQTLEQKQSARLLARRLRHSEQNPGPMTRAQIRRSQLLEKLKLLPGTRSPLMSAEDEALFLEDMIKTKRPHIRSETRGASWSQGGSGMGEGGPQCAVCHTSPRSVLVWPCRCLSLCEDCRIALAENNFSSCVCCRRDVVAFSRLYVP